MDFLPAPYWRNSWICVSVLDFLKPKLQSANPTFQCNRRQLIQKSRYTTHFQLVCSCERAYYETLQFSHFGVLSFHSISMFVVCSWVTGKQSALSAAYHAKWGSVAHKLTKYSRKTVASDIPTPRLFVVISAAAGRVKRKRRVLFVCVGCIFYSARSPRPAGESPASLAALFAGALFQAPPCVFSLSHTVTRRGVQVQGSIREINAASAEKGRGLIKICFTIGADHSRTKIITGALSTDGEREREREKNGARWLFLSVRRRYTNVYRSRTQMPIGNAKCVRGQQEADFIVDQIHDCIF
jgi:hypothetical protein